jgi:hypothetical protein
MTVEEAEKGLLKRKPNPAERKAIDRKGDAALELRIMGVRWDEIAETLGYASPESAKTAVERALQRNLMDRKEDTDDLRKMAAARYDRLLRSVWPKATDPGTEDRPNPEHLAAVKTAADITDRFVKLYGLAAPTEIAIRTPTQKELEEWVQTVSGKTALEEGDIWDAEIVEDEQVAEILADDPEDD